MRRRLALAFALLTAACVFGAWGGVARADRAAACDALALETRAPWDGPLSDEPTAGAPLGLASLPPELEFALSFDPAFPLLGELPPGDCSLLDGGACEEPGLSFGPFQAPVLTGRCEGTYGLALFRARAARTVRLTAQWPTRRPPPVAVATSLDLGQLAPAAPAGDVDPPGGAPRAVPASLSFTSLRTSADAAPSSITLATLAPGHARGLERPPRA